MSRRPLPVPNYRHHKQSGQALVTVRDAAGHRRDVLLGPYDTPESRAEYERVLALLRIGRLPWDEAATTTGLTVAEVLVRYWRHAQTYYTAPKVRDNVRLAIRPTRLLFGPIPAAEFSPLKLKAVREELVRSGLSRPVVNQRIGIVKRAFKWAVGEELIQANVYHALQAVGGLSRGRTTAREPEPIRPVPDAFVDAALPHASPTIVAMIELQRLTGMRPGEVVQMRGCDLDTSGPVWLYRPEKHKTAHRGKSRVVAIGPRAQAVLRPFLSLDTQATLFSPARAHAERAAVLRAARKSKVPPSQRTRGAGDRRKRPPGSRYTVTGYRNAVYRACDRADLAARQAEEKRTAAAENRLPVAVPAEVTVDDRSIPRWHPNQLRHTHATDVRRRFGLEAAQVVLGHARADVTQVYAEADVDLARKVAMEVG